jgi:4-amino-4-deoxy-L-arabinose transferase-like glycosyltransferase
MMVDKQTSPETAQNLWRRYRVPLIVLGIVLLVALYVAGVPHNPPGFYLDESSIAYNAHTIAQTGLDEYGNSWPLYFRAFGEYKNPTYVYLLAALYRLTGPSIFVARALSAALGLLAAFFLGILAWQITRQQSIGLIVGVIALFTPWFFELSRLVVEVAMYPLALALFLLVLHRVSSKSKWSQLEIIGLAFTLGLLTYVYSIGRLLAPLLGLGLLFFVTRKRVLAIIETWALYALTLVPLLIFNQRHPGALLTKFRWATYITSESTPVQIASEFSKHYLTNLSPWSLLFSGDSHQVAHIPSMGSLLIAPALIIVAGIVIVIQRHLRDPWWRFILYGVLAAVIPASLTRDQFPSLRLIAVPVFLLVLSVPGLVWLLDASARSQTRRAILALVLTATTLQVAVFQWRFHRTYRNSSTRLAEFDAQYPELLTAAAASGRRPIYLIDQSSLPGYIQAYWYGTLRGMDGSEFVRMPFGSQAPPEGVVITTEAPPANARIVSHTGPYTAYIAATATRTDIGVK